MKRLQYEYAVSVRLKFSREELDHCIAVSGLHYDGVCQDASKCGGFLYGMKNVIEIDKADSVKWTLTARELDTLCKILECEHYVKGSTVRLHDDLVAVLREANREWRRRNDKANQTER